ncbi:HAD family hydrolase [Azospirillum argentinense]
MAHSNPPGLAAGFAGVDHKIPCHVGIIFDLYGTLIHIVNKSFLSTLRREISRRIDRRDGHSVLNNVVRSFRQDVLIEKLDIAADCERLIRRHTPNLSAEDVRYTVDELLLSIRSELQSIALSNGVHHILRFVRKKGFRVGLVSNVSTFHKAPFYLLDMKNCFDSVLFSCDLGMSKPDPAIYRKVCQDLSINVESAIFVGDSYTVDVVMPEQLGMRAIHISRSRRHKRTVPSIGNIGLFDLEWGAAFIWDDVEAVLCNEFGAESISECELIRDSNLGKHNLMYRVEVQVNGRVQVFYLKRYLYPEAARLESLVYRLAHTVGLQRIRSALVHHQHSMSLIVEEAKGKRLTVPVNTLPGGLYELGRHAAFAYVFADADFRPRNSFFHEYNGKVIIEMIDFEHALFFRTNESAQARSALLVHEGAENDFAAIKSPITAKTMRRALREFIGSKNIESLADGDFRYGFFHQYNSIKKHIARIEANFYEYFREESNIIIGTRNYKRALNKEDVASILRRVGDCPEKIFRDTLC